MTPKTHSYLRDISALALCILFAIAICMSTYTPPAEPAPADVRDIEDTTRPHWVSDEVALEAENQAKLDTLYYAISMRESRGNPRAYNPREDAVSLTQMRKIFVDECNRIVRLQDSEAVPFRYEDRWDAELHRKMFDIVQLHHNPTLDVDVACEVHNHGCGRAYHQAVRHYCQQYPGRRES